MAKKQNLKTIQAKDTSRFQTDKLLKIPDYDSLPPIFSFHHMEYGGKNCLSRSDNAFKASTMSTLLRLSQQVWSQILSTRKETLGKENIPVKQFKVKLPRIVTPEVKSLIVFRLSKSERMAGIRHNDIYHILIVGSNLYKH